MYISKVGFEHKGCPFSQTSHLYPSIKIVSSTYNTSKDHYHSFVRLVNISDNRIPNDREVSKFKIDFLRYPESIGFDVHSYVTCFDTIFPIYDVIIKDGGYNDGIVRMISRNKNVFLLRNSVISTENGIENFIIFHKKKRSITDFLKSIEKTNCIISNKSKPVKLESENVMDYPNVFDDVLCVGLEKSELFRNLIEDAEKFREVLYEENNFIKSIFVPHERLFKKRLGLDKPSDVTRILLDMGLEWSIITEIINGLEKRN